MFYLTLLSASALVESWFPINLTNNRWKATVPWARGWCWEIQRWNQLLPSLGWLQPRCLCAGACSKGSSQSPSLWKRSGWRKTGQFGLSTSVSHRWRHWVACTKGLGLPGTPIKCLNCCERNTADGLFGWRYWCGFLISLLKRKEIMNPYVLFAFKNLYFQL